MTVDGLMFKTVWVGRGLKSFVGILVLFVLVCKTYSAHAVESGKLVEKDGQYVFVENQDPAVKLLLERAYEKGIITQEERDKAIKESEARAYLMQPSYKLWYDRGFNFSMNDNAFLLKIRGRLQMRETTRWRNDAWRNPGDAKNFRSYWACSGITARIAPKIMLHNSISAGPGCYSWGICSVRISSI